MTSSRILQHPLTIDEPVVVLRVGDYRALLAEAGYLPTPRLSRRLAAARTRYHKGRVIPWEQLKRELR